MLIRKTTMRGDNGDEGVAEVLFGVNGFGGGDAEIEDQQGHGYSEDAVA